jgi:hypothetical protein
MPLSQGDYGARNQVIDAVDSHVGVFQRQKRGVALDVDASREKQTALGRDGWLQRARHCRSDRRSGEHEQISASHHLRITEDGT